MNAAAAILGADFRGFWNRLLRRRAARLIIVVGLVWLVIALGFGFGGGITLGAFAPSLGPSSVAAILATAFTALAVFMLLIGFSTVVSAFYADRDLLLLATSPVPAGQVFVARLLRAAWASSLMSSLLTAALWGFGIQTGAGAGFLGLATLLVVLVVIAVTALQVLLLAAVVRVAPAHRIRDVANVVAAFTGTAFYVGWLVARAPGTDGGRPGIQLASGVQSLAVIGRRLGGFPTSWPAQALAAWPAPSAWLWVGATAAMALVVTAAAYVLFQVTFLNGLGAFLESGTRRRRQVRGAGAVGGSATPTVAIVRKDWTNLRRDGRRLVRILPGAVLAFAYPLLFFRSANSAGFWVIGFIPWFLAQIFGLPAVASEGRGLHLLRLASISSMRLVWAKTLGAALPVMLLSLLAVGMTIAVQGLNGGAPWLLGTTVWLAAGFTVISVGAGALAPRIDVDDPRRSVGFQGVALALAAGAVFGLLTMGGVAALYLAAALAAHRPPPGVLATWVTLLPLWSALLGAFLVAVSVLPPVGVLVAGSRALATREP